ncbi:transposase [Streptomyces sp. NPDC127066]|uniref:transposase n=1 Tax=Streptomyces sp. NPDC127066 TaxID=3347125 RepID=UPI0036529FE5
MDEAAIDGSHARALKGGSHRTFAGRPGPARPGSKHHLIVDRYGTLLVVSLTGGNRHDVTQLMPLLDAIPRIRGVRGRPRHRPGRLFADRGYDYDKYRRLLRARGITPKIARKRHRTRASTRWGHLPAEGWGTSATDDNAAGVPLLAELEGGRAGPRVQLARHRFPTLEFAATAVGEGHHGTHW